MSVDPMFMAALQALGQAGQQYFVGQQVQEVNARAQEIRSSLLPDMERRRALQELAQSASLSVSGAGGNATQMAAIQNLIPQTPSSAVQAVITGRLNGDRLMEKVGADLIKAEEDKDIRMLNLKLSAELQKEMAKKNAGRPLSEGGSKALTDLQQSKALVAQIKTLVNKNKSKVQGWIGPIDGRLPEIANSPENNAFRAQLGQLLDAYRTAVTGAAAADAEIARLETRMPNVTDTFDTFMAKLGAQDRTLRTRGQAVLDSYSKSGYDVSGWRAAEKPAEGFVASPAKGRASSFITYK